MLRERRDPTKIGRVGGDGEALLRGRQSGKASQRRKHLGRGGECGVQGPCLGQGPERAGGCLLGTEPSPCPGRCSFQAFTACLVGGLPGASPVSFFGGTALIAFERQPTSCPFPSDPGPRGNAFLLFSVAKDSGFPAPTSKGLCTLSRVSCSIPCLPSGNLPPDAPLGVPSPSALSPCRGNGVLSITVWVGDEHELQAGQTWGLLMVGWGQSISSGLIN